MAPDLPAPITMITSTGLLLRDALLADGARVDVRIRGDRIAAVAPAGMADPHDGEEVLDLDGYLLLPSPVEPHAHLDKAMTADRFPAPAGTLLDAVDQWHRQREGLSAEDVGARARRAVEAAILRGVTAIRTHVDVGPGIELRAVEAALALREALRGTVEVQVVALAYPLAGEAGAANRARLRRAAELGVDLIGGAPHITPGPAAELATALAIATEHGLPVDLHTDERLEESDGLAQLAARCIAGFAHQATASHCVSLGTMAHSRQQAVAASVAAAGVGVVTCPLTNLLLQGRDRGSAAPRGLTALDALQREGAIVAAGGDNVQDIFNPIGCGDPLQTAQLLVAAGHRDVATAYRMVSDDARAVMGLPAVRIEPGRPAELLAVAAGSLREAIATATEDRVVVRGARVLARTRVAREVRLSGVPA